MNKEMPVFLLRHQHGARAVVGIQYMSADTMQA